LAKNQLELGGFNTRLIQLNDLATFYYRNMTVDMIFKRYKLFIPFNQECAMSNKSAKKPAAPKSGAASPAVKPVATKPIAKSAPAKPASVKPVVAKPVMPKPVAKPVAKAPAKPAAKPTSKPKTKATAKKAAPKKVVKKAKPEKVKMERDSFTMPKDEYAQLTLLKARLTAMGQPAKKSELLRAGIKLLAAMSDNTLKTTLAKIPVIKTGRPNK
jgi:hypothetical protein